MLDIRFHCDEEELSRPVFGGYIQTMLITRNLDRKIYILIEIDYCIFCCSRIIHDLTLYSLCLYCFPIGVALFKIRL